MQGETERFFPCPYCGSPISMVFDLTAGHQSYTEDCEVCCRPIDVSFQTDGEDIVSFGAHRQDD